MLIVHSLNEASEPLVDYEMPTRRWVLNGEHSLKFGVYETLNNVESFDLIENECVIECENDYYRVKQLDKRSVGNKRYKYLGCLHVVFDLERERVYSSLSGSLRVDQAMDFITKGTLFTYSIEGDFNTVLFESFGNDNGWELFKKILEQYEAEFEVEKYHIVLKNRVGQDKDFQFRYKHNITAVEETIDSNDLRTYIKGYGKKDDNGNPIVTSEYLSPNSSVYGILHAEPIDDERFTNQSSLQKYIISKLEDTPKISIKFDYHTVSDEIGQDIRKGDSGWLIHEKLGIEVYTRVVEVSDYPGIQKDPIITIGNVLLNGTEEIVKRRGG